MYLNFFNLLAIFLFYYNIFFFSFTKFLLKFSPVFFNDKPILLAVDGLELASHTMLYCIASY